MRELLWQATRCRPRLIPRCGTAASLHHRSTEHKAEVVPSTAVVDFVDARRLSSLLTGEEHGGKRHVSVARVPAVDGAVCSVGWCSDGVTKGVAHGDTLLLGLIWG